jgi:endoglycosylceramidase
MLDAVRFPRARAAAAAAAALLLAGASCDLGIPGVPPGPGQDGASFRLPALHAEPDPVAGGRILDAAGREVILRGVNVNAFVEYWQFSPTRFTTYPFTVADADLMQQMGWNAVRLLISWSRVEPESGVYDEAYLDQVEQAVALLESRGLYAIIDLHQDAWGPTLAARPDENCKGHGQPAFGWDGAPGWATQDGGKPRCAPNGTRELSQAVMAAFQAFWNDAPGPDGIGIRTHYARMLGHVAARFAPRDSVAGYDVMNEPNALYLIAGQLDALAALYADAIAEIRAGEASVGAPARLVLFEPGITWADFGQGAPPDFAHDDQVVYSPHIYQGGLNALPLDASVFQQARDEAVAYGGAPIVVGEWGSDPSRAADPSDGYFDEHQALQDQFHFGATLWTWREACGDPHKTGDWVAGRIPSVWGFFDVDCATNTILGMRAPLAAALTRGLLRASPGRLATVAFDPVTRVLTATGDAAVRSSFVAFLPAGGRDAPWLDSSGIEFFSWKAAPGGGLYVTGFMRPGSWSLSVQR